MNARRALETGHGHLHSYIRVYILYSIHYYENLYSSLTGAYTALSLIVILVSVYLYGPNDFALPFVTKGPIVLQAIVLAGKYTQCYIFCPF